MDKLAEKGSKLVQALRRLEEALTDYEIYHQDSVHDGVIQRFEFTTELAWKTMREYLIDQGWLDLLTTRNLTSHIYDDDTAAKVFNKVQDSFCPLFHALIKALELE